MKNKYCTPVRYAVLLMVAMVSLFCSAFGTDWYMFYNTKWPDGITPRPTLAWSETYVLRSYISMYRAAKVRNEPQAEQDKWLSRIIAHCDTIVSSPAMAEEGRANLVYAGHGFTPLAMAVNLIYDDDALYDQYHLKADLYLRYLEEKLIPFWRNFQIYETPFNWYLSYGTMLLYLHRSAGSKHYSGYSYQTPDTTLKGYYNSTVTEMAAGYFQDFHNWEYTGSGWNNTAYPLNKGLCYYPDSNSYIWRYFDYAGSLVFWGYTGENEYQGLEEIRPFVTDRWYDINLHFNDDSLTMNVSDDEGNSIIRSTTEWTLTNTDSDLSIGKRVDGNEYFNGVTDEVRFSRDSITVALWKMEGNANDSSGNGFHGTVHGSPETVDGSTGKALRFGNGNYITVPDNPAFDSINRIDLRVKFGELNTARYYILGRGKHFHYGPGGFHLFMDCYKRPEDVGHANLDIEFMAGVANDKHFNSLYPDSIVKRFCNTFTKIIRNNSDTTHPVFRSHIDPSGSYGDADGDSHLFRWLWLWQYEPLIGTLVNGFYEAHPADQNMSEAVANLACMQAGVKIADDEKNAVEEAAPEEWPDWSVSTCPNPTGDYLAISYSAPDPADINITIFNSTGTELGRFGAKELRGRGSIGLSTRDYPIGVYYITMKSGTVVKTGRFIIAR